MWAGTRFVATQGVQGRRLQRPAPCRTRRQLLDDGAASSSTSRRLSALSSFYRHLVEHDLVIANPAAAVRPSAVDQDHTATFGLDSDQPRALITAADADTSPVRLHRGRCPAAAASRAARRLARRCRPRSRSRSPGAHRDPQGQPPRHRRAPPATAAALDAYLVDRLRAHRAAVGPTAAELCGPLLTTASGGRLDKAALWKLVRRLARAADIPSWAQLSPYSLRHPAITLALDGGAHLRAAQDFAGHRDPRTTRRYDRPRHTSRGRGIATVPVVIESACLSRNP
ncbi:tyrosine-type recombinase/integrase [Pseudonocardia sichuanensis]